MTYGDIQQTLVFSPLVSRRWLGERSTRAARARDVVPPASTRSTVAGPRLVVALYPVIALSAFVTRGGRFLVRHLFSTPPYPGDVRMVGIVQVKMNS